MEIWLTKLIGLEQKDWFNKQDEDNPEKLERSVVPASGRYLLRSSNFMVPIQIIACGEWVSMYCFDGVSKVDKASFMPHFIILGDKLHWVFIVDCGREIGKIPTKAFSYLVTIIIWGQIWRPRYRILILYPITLNTYNANSYCSRVCDNQFLIEAPATIGVVTVCRLHICPSYAKQIPVTN